MKIQKTSPEWEGYAKDTKWHVVNRDGRVLEYFYTKRDAQSWIDVVALDEDEEVDPGPGGWSSFELNVGQWS